jgi:hypothetical protein
MQMRTRFTGISLVSMAIFGLAALGGCPAGDDGGGSGGTLDGADDDAPSTMTAAATMTADDGATGMMDDGGSGDTMVDPTLTGGGSADDAPTCPQEPQEAGGSCTDNCECISEKCFSVPLIGGSCGECVSDADCPDGGCSIPNPLAMPPQGSVCNMGEAGGGCETDDVCQEGLFCGTLLDVPGVLTLSTCGVCLVDADCGEQLCSPTIDVANFTGQKLCVDAGSVPNGQACDLMGTGNDACMSGLCATVDIMGIAQVGVCGDCSVDADCDVAAGEVCTPADIDTTTGEVTAPTCAVP